MGLDLALAGLVLVMAVRGWLKGFVLQAVRLAGVVLCVYAADPVRDLAKPHVLPYLPTIRTDLIDRGLWWASAVVSYIVLVGLATVAVKLYRRQPYGLEDLNRNDQLAGSMLGLVKGLVVAAFLVMAIEKYAITHVKGLPWAEAQARESTAVFWNEQYHPGARIWSATPVQYFVNHVKRMGLTEPTRKPEEPPTVQTASRTPRLQWAAPDCAPTDTQGLDPEVVEAVEAIKNARRRAERPN